MLFSAATGEHFMVAIAPSTKQVGNDFRKYTDQLERALNAINHTIGHYIHSECVEREREMVEKLIRQPLTLVELKEMMRALMLTS